MAQRQAWCPRCDEVLPARPGRPCPTCGRTLLDVPARVGGGRAPSPRPDLRVALWRARGQARPAARAGLAGLVTIALVAGMFLVGRVTRASSTAGAATTSTVAGRLDPNGDSQIYDWSSGTVEGIGLRLRSIDAGDRSTTLRLQASGIPDALSIATLKGLSITDASGHQLLRSAPIPEVPARSRGPFAGVTVDDRLTDEAAVDRIQVDAVTLTSQVEEELAVTVVDPRLRHPPLRDSDPCKGCKLDVHCTNCPTMAVAGSTYHQGEVVLLLAPKGPLDRSVLGGHLADVVVNDQFASQAAPTVDREPGGGVTAVQFSAEDLAAGGTDARLQLQVIVSSELRRTVEGPWRIGPR